MIPVFPEFKKIELSDRVEIEELTSQFPPYSDFNFTSLWAWDTKGENMFSKLNGNLIVRFTDYETGHPLFSFIGNNKSEQTAKQLIDFAESLGVSPVLYFLPEESIKDFKDTKFSVGEDKNHFDYIYNVSDLADLLGPNFKDKRNLVSKFVKQYPQASFELKDLSNGEVREQIISVLNKWQDKKRSNPNTKNSYSIYEEIAINRLLQTHIGHKLVVSCVFIDGHMIGFSIDEITRANFAISHFFKADTSFKGVYDFLNKKTSEYLQSNNVKFWNWEQDLGKNNLKKSKLSYCPIFFLKKYKVSLTS